MGKEKTDSLACKHYELNWIELTQEVQTAVITLAMVFASNYAAGIVSGVAALMPMWGVALSVLGINLVKRSQDKAVAAGAGQPVG